MSPDLLTKVILPIALFLVMFGMGLSLRLRDFKNVLQAPKVVSIGLIGQLIVLPVMAFVIAITMNLPPEIAMGLMIIALAPGGATSNMLTYLFKGDTSLSISLTAAVSIITPFTIPVVVAITMGYFMGSSTEFEMPIIKTISQLLAITVIPVALGMFVLSKWNNTAIKLENILKWLSIGFLLLIIILIVIKNHEHMLDFFAQAGLATLLLNIAALAIGYYLAKMAKLPQSQATCIGFEVGIQNGTLALLVAGTLIGNDIMMIPAVTYSLFMLLTGVIFGYLIKKPS